MPRGAHSATAIATRPSTMKYQVPYWASDFCRAKKMILWILQMRVLRVSTLSMFLTWIFVL